MDGHRVVRIDDVVDKVDIFVTATGNKKVILRHHMNRMKNGAIVCNMGHADTEIEVASLKTSDITVEKVTIFSYILFKQENTCIIIFIQRKIKYLSVNSITIFRFDLMWIMSYGQTKSE